MPLSCNVPAKWHVVSARGDVTRRRDDEQAVRGVLAANDPWGYRTAADTASGARLSYRRSGRALRRLVRRGEVEVKRTYPGDPLRGYRLALGPRRERT